MQVDRLLREHSKLRTLSTDLVTVVSSHEPCALDELAHRRWDLARMVHMHLAHEERLLFSPLETDPRLDVRAAAAKARRGIEELHSSYKAHVERWNADAVVKRWPGFQVAVRHLVMRMIDTIDHEEVNFYPLVAHVDEPERRWQPGMRNWAGDGVALQPLIRGAFPCEGTESDLSITSRPAASRT